MVVFKAPQQQVASFPRQTRSLIRILEDNQEPYQETHKTSNFLEISKGNNSDTVVAIGEFG